MKKKLRLIVLAIGLCGTAGAQLLETPLPGYKTTFEANPFWHNWFISFNAGVNSLRAEHSKDADFSSTITFMPVLSVGKWFNPWWGVRAQGGGGALHGFKPNGGNLEMLHYHYMYVHADAMVGLINFFAPYKENRRFDIVPFVGIGGMTNSKDQSFTMNAGIQFRYALSPRFDINIEASGMILDDDLVQRSGFPNDGITGLTGGITYRFKNRGFKKAPTSDELATLVVANLLLAEEIATLKKTDEIIIIDAIEDQKSVKEQPVPASTRHQSISATIPFKFNSSVLEDTYDPMIYNIAVFMKDNPDTKIRIVGYADKFGPINVNMKISEQRANAVAKALKSTYGISADRIKVEYVGKDKPYYVKENKWNRCAIVDVIE